MPRPMLIIWMDDNIMLIVWLVFHWTQIMYNRSMSFKVLCWKTPHICIVQHMYKWRHYRQTIFNQLNSMVPYVDIISLCHSVTISWKIYVMRRKYHVTNQTKVIILESLISYKSISIICIKYMSWLNIIKKGLSLYVVYIYTIVHILVLRLG